MEITQNGATLTITHKGETTSYNCGNAKSAEIAAQVFMGNEPLFEYLREIYPRPLREYGARKHDKRPTTDERDDLIAKLRGVITSDIAVIEDLQKHVYRQSLALELALKRIEELEKTK